MVETLSERHEAVIARYLAENKRLREALIALKKQYCDIESVINHANHFVSDSRSGDLEPVASFFESNDIGAVDMAEKALAGGEEKE